jgi:hypothetical protein
VAGNEFVFGAYTHCSWPAADGIVADPSGKSFLFSLVNESGKAVRFSLRDKDRAIELTDGISFGADKIEDGNVMGVSNFVLMFRRQAADEEHANTCNHPLYENTAYMTDEMWCDEKFLAGNEYFAAAEIEVFQL